jgi:GDP-L-fucose synthase
MSLSYDRSTKIFVAGARGMVGSAMVRALARHGLTNIVGPTSRELDLTNQRDVEDFLADERPSLVILAAARVGGILANSTYRAEFIHTNLAIQTNVIHGAWKAGVQELLFFSSACVYPRVTEQPMREEQLWTGPVESTSEPYAVAKLAGMSMCQAYNSQYGTRYLSVIPTNLYGPHDNYDPTQSHVMAALIQKVHHAKTSNQRAVTLWGTGQPRRDLMYVDDAAEAALVALNEYKGRDYLNIGTGHDHTIRELAEIVKDVIGYDGAIEFDASHPDGAPRKMLDANRMLGLGWTPAFDLRRGIELAYEWYLQPGKVS